MPVFAYEALDRRSRATISGTIAADTPRAARDALRARGLSIQRVEQTCQPADGGTSWLRLARLRRCCCRRRGGGKRDQHKLVSFIRELATLLAVGVPLLEALDSSARRHRGGSFRTTLLLLRDRVAAGSSLASAMRQQPEVFDELCVQISQVGEESGSLDTALERLARFKERSRQLKGRAANALIYPAIVLGMALIVSLFLMSFVVPNILQPLVEMGRPLPLPTRIVKGASDLLLAWWWLIGACLVLLVVSSVMLLRTSKGRWLWHRLLLRLPLLGELVQKAAVVRIAVVTSTLLRSGIVFVQALDVARRTTSNVVLAEALLRCQRAISAGGQIARALESTQAFPPLVVQIFSVGQQSGRLEEMLDKLASDWDEEVAIGCQRLAGVLEPFLIVILALLVLLIAMATMLPILEAGDVLQ
ncbi:type II secretion system F family protein [Fontivita pretiosa]|uniref:type II secretion system F family protein n=1 Tax=Fontivita pretiosa TaxID=2989684 RepID=UPI003D17CEB0